MRVEATPAFVMAAFEKTVSRVVVVPVPAVRSTMVTAGWVVVLALAVSGAHSPVVTLQAPAAEPTPHWASVVQLPVHTPLARLQVDVAPNAEQLPVAWHCPNWNTPVGPAGEAHVLVT